MSAQNNNLLFGDIAFYWLPHITKVREGFPNLKIVCLQRPREETTESWLQKCIGFTQLRPRDRIHTPEWWDQFPTIDAPTIRMAWDWYWDFYYAEVRTLDNVFWMQTSDLNNDRCIMRLYDYLEIPHADRVLIPSRKFNAIEKTDIHFCKN
jgi:hypothetical protein